MIQTYDVGSIPFVGDIEKFSRGAKLIDTLLEFLYVDKYSLDKKYFEEKIIECLLDKIRAGVNIPNYPQFRDMNAMFLSLVNEVKETKEGYMITGPLSIDPKKRKIPEVDAIERNTREISNKFNNPLAIKICVTGPYTLSSLFNIKEYNIFSELAKIVTQIVEANLFNHKFGRVEFVTIDEPVFGLIDDPLLDYGSSRREELLKAWESIFHAIKTKNAKTCIHLHGTSNELFWQIKSLNIIESHVEDSLYSDKMTKEIIEREDKFLKASISKTDFDSLIRDHLVSKFKITDEAVLNQRIADTWTDMQKGKINPIIFLEDADVIEGRLRRIIKKFGEERVPYAGPECGLKSFPTYDSAIECLRRVSSVSNPIIK